MKSFHKQIDNTYGSTRLTKRLLDSLQDIGLDLTQLTTADLITFDELHVMGRQATVALGQLAGLHERMQVLDIGSGLGGPARTLAQSFGCHVTGVDLSAEFVHAAIELSRCVGLEQKVSFRPADALALPFEDNGFDAVFMIHLNMNIEDKTALFREAKRVLKPGACLVLWEVCAGSKGPVIYPLPWADRADFSHLVCMQTLVDAVRQAGLLDLRYEDATEEAVAWVKERLAAMKKPRTRRPTPDLDLVLKEFRLKRSNVSKNLMQNTLCILRAVGVKGYGR